jgi:hypothetical protein
MQKLWETWWLANIMLFFYVTQYYCIIFPKGWIFQLNESTMNNDNPVVLTWTLYNDLWEQLKKIQ